MRDINPDWDPQIDVCFTRPTIINQANAVQEIMVLSPKHKTKAPVLHQDDVLARRRKTVIALSHTVFIYIDVLFPVRCHF